MGDPFALSRENSLVWQTERASSRQRHAEAAEVRRLRGKAAVRLPELMLASCLDVHASAQDEVDALIRGIEASVSTFETIEAELMAERADALQRKRHAQQKQRRSGAHKALQKSKSDTVLFFESRQRYTRPQKPSSEKLPSLVEKKGRDAQGKRYSHHQGQWGQGFGLRAAKADDKAFGGRIQLVHGDGAPPIGEQLRRILQRNLLRMVDVFRRWDVDGSGEIDADEFYEAICALGYDVPPAEAERLFESFDLDGSGTVDYRELQAALQGERGGEALIGR